MENLRLRLRYRDLLGNEYEPVEVPIKIVDQRTQSKPVLDIPIVVEKWDDRPLDRWQAEFRYAWDSIGLLLRHARARIISPGSSPRDGICSVLHDGLGDSGQNVSVAS